MGSEGRFVHPLFNVFDIAVTISCGNMEEHLSI
jgi:hypothetical protein